MTSLRGQEIASYNKKRLSMIILTTISTVDLGSSLGKKKMSTWLTSSTLIRLDDLPILFIKSNSHMRASMFFTAKLKAKINLGQVI